MEKKLIGVLTFDTTKILNVVYSIKKTQIIVLLA